MLNPDSLDFEQGYERKTLRSMDGSTEISVQIARPDRYRKLQECVLGSPAVIPRGAGLSYCLASAGVEVLSVSSARFDRILAFDPDAGTIEVESGLTLGAMLAFLIPKGFWFPVLPGHPLITVGGCVAFNVHGKSQFHSGMFGDHVLKFELFHPAHGRVQCSREMNPGVFDLTLGGMGLTGFITKVTLRCERRRGESIQRRRIRARSLEHAIELLTGAGTQADQVYSWNDLNLRGKNFGRGFVYLEDFSEEPCSNNFKTGHFSASCPFRVAHRLIGTFGLSFINPVFNLMEQIAPESTTMNLLAAAFPLNGKEIYLNACGSRGFREYQVIIPSHRWHQFQRSFSDLLSKLNVRTTLGSLKLFKGQRKLLNFVQDGICLAVDVPQQDGSEEFLSEMDDLVIDCGGIPNLSKDSRLTARVVQKSYPEYDRFRFELLQFDPQKRMNSELRARIDV